MVLTKIKKIVKENNRERALFDYFGKEKQLIITNKMKLYHKFQFEVGTQIDVIRQVKESRNTQGKLIELFFIKRVL